MQQKNHCVFAESSAVDVSVDDAHLIHFTNDIGWKSFSSQINQIDNGINAVIAVFNARLLGDQT